MKRIVAVMLVMLFGFGCKRMPTGQTAATPTKFGVAIVDIGGEKQAASTGASLDQPVVAQVNDAQGNAVAGALVQFSGTGGVRFDPAAGLTGNDGQFSTTVRLGEEAGLYSLVAATYDKSGKAVQVKFPEIALDYQQNLGRELNEKYCSRCHNSESSAEKVSNHDNLTVAPHAFSDGATLNPMSHANLIAIIGHGGAALGKSTEMPPYSATLSANDIEALAAYIRAVADPPYQSNSVQGVFHANP